MSSSILFRVRPILFSVLMLGAGHNLFFVLLPVRLKQSGVDESMIGFAMSLFAVGNILAGLWASRIVIRVGHVRAFVTTSATLSSIAIAHSYLDDVWVTALLRLLAGFCLYASLIILESWLSVLCDRRTRGRIFGLSQICFSLGFGTAPLFLNVAGGYDVRIFGIVSVLLSFALVAMSMTRLPAPEIPASACVMSLRRLWACSPEGMITGFCAGLVGAASISLVSLYAFEKGLVGIWLAIVLGSYQLGVLVTQLPSGWLADRFDKGAVAIGLMLLGMLGNALIVLDAYYSLPQIALVALFILSGGAGAALFPLAVTQVFDRIGAGEALPATATLKVLLGVGGILGPLIAGFLMHRYGVVALYCFIVAVHAAALLLLLVRSYRSIRRETGLQPQLRDRRHGGGPSLSGLQSGADS
ncbi:MFS transporter [Marinobacterium nitratireducens]|uniref:MFS transporter n=1 Tax=Marinobacterium nitratireducens TaxID=518897 RepID=A0A918DS19_9GAMM|nr:MFS transporter [Marinobacterium nitratireducens]GGO81717.1 MFS transporter [Marinobacterium nitratireducens]